MSEFPILRVDRSLAEAVEMLGSKPKFWFRQDSTRYLFKADDRGTGEDWAEVVAARLCRLLGLPHVEYELAVECEGENTGFPGVVCANMAPKPKILALGNELLLALDPDYPLSQRFKVRQHTIGAVADLLGRVVVPGASWVVGLPAGVESALGVFVGYVMLDAWIANQDRHHENWGAIWEGNVWRLAPTFDHGAALARNLTDREREERLRTKDRFRSMPAFAARGRSAFYGSAADTRPLELREAFRAFGTLEPTARDAWLKALQGVDLAELESILKRVPEHRMSAIGREFTLALLVENQHRLLE